MKNEILIGNNCLVGYIYRDILMQEYQTPFIWSRIWNEDFIKLLEHYKEIDFENFELKKVNKKINNKDNDFYILLDDTVKIFYEHYKFDKNYNKPSEVDNIDIHYNKIWEYIYEKFKIRCERMSKSEKPIIIFNDHDPTYDPLKIIKICEEKNYRLLAFTDRIKKKNAFMLTVLPNIENGADPNKIIETYKNEILEFIKSENFSSRF